MNDRAAIQKMIDDCAAAGGGTVRMPAGDYVTGTLHLRSRVTLHLESGATIQGSTNQDDYDRPNLICAENASDVAIVGPGRIDGQGEAFWVKPETGFTWRPKAWRPERLIHFENCRNVLMRDVIVTNAPKWTIHPFRCDNVRIAGVTILNPLFGPNTDGIDPNCSTNVHISDCHIVAGDDCIVIKATQPYPCENITMTNCTLETTCGAVKLGTESHGDIRHVTISNCVIRNTRTGISIYLKDGGTMEHILFTDISMELIAKLPGHVEWPIYIDMERRHEDSKVGVVRDVTLSNVMIRTKGRCVIQGMTSSPIERLRLNGVTLKVAGYEGASTIGRPRGGRTSWQDPESGKNWDMEAFFVFTNCRDLRVRDLDVVHETDAEAPARAVLWCDQVDGAHFDSVSARPARREAPFARLVNCRDALLSQCHVLPGTDTFLAVEGDRTKDLRVHGSILSHVTRTVDGEMGAAVDMVGNHMP